MDLTKLRQGEKIAAISAVALFLIMIIFKWFGLKLSGAFGGTNVSVEGSKNAWGSYGFTDIVLLITVLAALGLAYLSASNQRLNLPVAASAIVTALGILSLILIIISIISPPDFGASGSGIDHTRKIGVFLGLIATAALTYGGYLAMQEEGTSLGEQADRLRGRGTGGGAPPPPPPPSSGGPPPPSA
jgi:hypothetical protein